MKKKQLLSSDCLKKVYEIEKEDNFIIEFLTNNPFKKSQKKKFAIRGECNSALSEMILEYLESYHVPTYFVKKLDTKQMKVKKFEPIPIRVLIRNIVAGSLCDIFAMPEGKQLEYPVIEYYLKNEKLNNPMVNEYHIYALGAATSSEMNSIARMSTKINAVMKAFFKRRNLKLVNLKVEFGRIKGKVTVCDEFSIETSSIWDKQSDERFDAVTIKKSSDSFEQFYKNFMKKLNISK
ncbi:phosphoribosylaminoimidazolesuccinocarboxamide synthase [candidate division KSB1 bacterium]